MASLPDAFAKNRNEEVGEDNWTDFIVPPFFERLDIKKQSKSVVIMGGRGTGKTTLLRYFCHASQFSPRRGDPSDVDLSHVGLYWRADTNFLNSFVGEEQSPRIWAAAFQHVLACELGAEIIKSLHNLNCTIERREKFGLLDQVDLTALTGFDESLGSSLADLAIYLKRSRMKLSAWLNNLESQDQPVFLPAGDFLNELVSAVKEQVPYLSNTTFAVFIDEYENLRDEQQKYINGLLKHCKKPLLFNIAMKRNGWRTQETIGPESIQDISDYRIIDLEELLADDFELFAAELLFFRLGETDPNLIKSLPIIPERLRSVDFLKQRYANEKYRSEVISAAGIVLPRVSENGAAARVLNDGVLSNTLYKKIEHALKRRQSRNQAEEYIDKEKPEASVIMPALLNREREDPDLLLKEFRALKSGEARRLERSSDLVTNNLFGCVNEIYLASRRNSILFSGFKTLTLMARGNIRHLLELIYRVFRGYGGEVIDELPTIPPDVQAEAIKAASESILATVTGHGTYGPQLYALVQCLGSVFRERHRSVKQSEPEINHFTIAEGDIDVKLRDYLNEAEKWSILFLTRETKMKSTGATSSDYVLNPIFASYFQISFRKKRSLALSGGDLMKMLEGDQRTRDDLVRRIGRVNGEGEISDLFGNMLE